MTIGKNCIVAGNFPDNVPDNHACINLKAFDNLDHSPAVLGPAGDGDICVCIFKVPAHAKPKGQAEHRVRSELILLSLLEQVSKMCDKTVDRLKNNA